MFTLAEAKKHLIDKVNIEAKGANFTYGEMSYYAFKNNKWGSACNVVYIVPQPTAEGRFLLLSEFRNKFCDEKWSLSEAEHVLLEDAVYIITNLTKEEIDFVKKFMLREYALQKNYC